MNYELIWENSVQGKKWTSSEQTIEKEESLCLESSKETTAAGDEGAMEPKLENSTRQAAGPGLEDKHILITSLLLVQHGNFQPFSSHGTHN